MKRLILFLIFWCLSGVSVNAQNPSDYLVYLPIIQTFNPCEEVGMSDWKIVVPEATINKALNPSAETTANFAAGGAATVTRSTTFQKYGLYSFRAQTAADNEGIELTLGTLANAIHYATVRVRGTLPAVWDWSLDDATYTSPTLLEQIDGNWALYGVQFPAAQANASTTLYIDQNGAGSGDFYLDGAQVEEKEYWTTYCDGTQQGCASLGAAHASTSERSAQSRAGGRVRDLEDDYGLNIGGVMDTGTAPIGLSVDEYAILPGGEINSVKIEGRSFTISGVINGPTQQDFHDKKDALARVLDPLAFPGLQPLLLRYEGTTVHKEIAVEYEDGLNTNIKADDPCYWEQVAIRFFAPNPYWLEIGESAVELDTNDSGTDFENIAHRSKTTGQWDNLGMTFANNGPLTYAEDATYIYIGGPIVNWETIPNADGVARYHKQTGVWSALGTGTLTSVQGLIVGPDGTLYAVGSFTTIGGVAANRIGAWDGSTWSALGSGLDDETRAITIGQDGKIYVSGLFLNAGGGAANRIASWDGSTWSALGSGLNSVGDTLAAGIDGKIYVGGQFTTAGGGSALRIASWNPDDSTWSALAGGSSGNVLALAVNSSGIVYKGGETSDYIQSWNGTAWSDLGSGVNNTVTKLSVGPDDVLYAAGAFTVAGGITLGDRLARWNEYAWAHLDIDLPGSASLPGLFVSRFADPVIEQNYDIFVSYFTGDPPTFAGAVTATNDGSVQAFPKIVFARSGGTTAVIETLRNETTGKELLFDYALLDGETLTIDLDPLAKSITSSFFGSRLDAVLKNSDFGEWALPNGDSNITSYINESGTPTLVKYMQWRDAYSGYD